MAASRSPNGASKWITSEDARADVQHWRAQCGATLTSAATVLADDPRLDVRIETPRQPLRVVLDRRRRVRRQRANAGADRVRHWCSRPPPRRGVRRRRGEVGRGARRTVRVARAHLDLRGCSRGWGSSRSTRCWWRPGRGWPARCSRPAWWTNGCCTWRPKLLGEGAKPLAALPRLRDWRLRRQFDILESRTVGPDLRLRLQPARQEKETCSQASCRKSARFARWSHEWRRRRGRAPVVGFRPSRGSDWSWAPASAWMACASRSRNSMPTVSSPTSRAKRCASRRSATSAPAAA